MEQPPRRKVWVLGGRAARTDWDASEAGFGCARGCAVAQGQPPNIICCSHHPHPHLWQHQQCHQHHCQGSNAHPQHPMKRQGTQEKSWCVVPHLSILLTTESKPWVVCVNVIGWTHLTNIFRIFHNYTSLNTRNMLILEAIIYIRWVFLDGEVVREITTDIVGEVMDMVGRLTRWSKRWPSPSFFMLKLSDFY